MKHMLLSVFLAAATGALAQRNLVYEDHIYQPVIKTVQLYPDGGEPQDMLLPAVGQLGQPGLVLEFDDLQGNRTNYYAKLIHCNFDWTKSTLMDLDFLNDYNEFPINDYTFSGATFQPYVHYRFPVPTVKVAGNYLLIVYRDDASHLALSKRMMIYVPAVSVLPDKQTSGGALSFTRQPLNFIVDYNSMQIINPMESVHIVIRQNQRWDNALVDVRPTFLRDAENQLEYRSFDADKAFPGGNEFRFVDFRSLNYPGQNTGPIDRTSKPWHLYVQPDQPRSDQSYAQYNDLDGNYQIDNRDNGDGKTNSNYLPVTFTLKTSQPFTDPVYLIGAFNQWNRNDENRLQYDAVKGAYEATVVLKQGIYDYLYWVDSKKQPGAWFEGDHFETENKYEILVYNRSFQPNADMLIGYYTLTLNPR